MKMDKELIIFDLDGTLIDSSGDIAWVTNRLLAETGREVMAEDDIKACIGWGVKMLLEQVMPGEGPEALEKARIRFLQIYDHHLVVDTTLYEGVLDALRIFKEKGKKLAVVSNKPVGLTAGILEEFGIRKYFGSVLGGDSLKVRKPSPEPLIHVMNELNCAPEQSVMVGDSPVDCEAGKAAGMATIGALYGFRPEEELRRAAPDILVKDFKELTSILA